jgi:Protein of unknown function (DUF3631)
MRRDERPEDRPPTPEAIVTQARDVVWPDSYRVPGDLLDELVQFVRRFVVLDNEQCDAIALWVLHTHCFAAARRTPYLGITSAEAESGKTRLLEVLERLVANPWLTERTSAAALIRTLEKEKPTLLLDESDTAFSSDKEYAEALRNVLNSGYRRHGSAVICVKEGGDWVPRRFNTYSPKAVAGIGKLPTTVASRSIPIRLQRRAPGETVEDFYEDEAEDLAAPLRVKAEAFAESSTAELEQARRPSIPQGLRDRAAECWRPLFAIADLAGEEWSERSRKAALSLSMGARGDEASMGIRLLEDVRALFAERETDTLFSSALVPALNEIETSPWAEWNKGRGLTAPSLAKLLHRYGIKPRSVRIGDETAKGYKLDAFGDAFQRYLEEPDTLTDAVSAVTTSQPASVNGSGAVLSRHTTPLATTTEQSSNPHEQTDVTGVTVEIPDTEEADYWAARIRSYEEGEV